MDEARLAQFGFRRCGAGALTTANKTAVVVTSIAEPNGPLREIAAGCVMHGMDFYVVGDARSPSSFALDGCRFFSVERQMQTGLRFAALCPTGSYARKNVGYLLAMKEGAQIIVDTDDDNIPQEAFWRARRRRQTVSTLRRAGCANVYKYFTESYAWPRGLPLDAVRDPLPPFEDLPIEDRDCPIQQGLVDGNPDVDAIYRLVLPLPIVFRKDRRLALGTGAWCPVNSQNTSWWRDAFPLLYLPAYCSMRMTDIWRGLIAQRIAWENGWSVLHHESTVTQQRNEHDLMADFEAEIPGYRNNRWMVETLGALTLTRNIPQNLRTCYGSLVRLGLIDAKELPLLEAWLEDLDAVNPLAHTKGL
jgi:hypothetical protein